MAGEPTTQADLQAENAELRARVEALETEIAELRSSTAKTVAQAQQTLYWFERWGVDFNALFSRPAMEHLRKGVRGARSVYRAGLKAKRRVL